MYSVTKRFQFAGSHRLKLNYESPCQNVHGHNWTVTVTVKAEHLDSNGMVLDFSHIKAPIMLLFDHGDLNHALETYCSNPDTHTGLSGFLCYVKYNPTAEVLATVIAEIVNRRAVMTSTGRKVGVSRVEVIESENNSAVWTEG